MAYANAKLVVHRDLKPANILVSEDGQVHLLDFGIARLLEDGRARESEVTRVWGRTFTPDYASPEQIAGEPITVASDVYSLGVMLYELLTDARPYRPKRDTWGALEDAILHDEPVRPSEAAPASRRRRAPRRPRHDRAQGAEEEARRALRDRQRAGRRRRALPQSRPVLARPDTVGYRLAQVRPPEPPGGGRGGGRARRGPGRRGGRGLAGAAGARPGATHRGGEGLPDRNPARHEPLQLDEPGHHGARPAPAGARQHRPQPRREPRAPRGRARHRGHEPAQPAGHGRRRDRAAPRPSRKECASWDR